MRQFLGFLSVVLVSMVVGTSVNAEDKTRKKVEVDFFWFSDLVTIDTSGSDRSLNLGKDPFRVFCDHAKLLAPSPNKYGCGAGTRKNLAYMLLYDNETSHPSGETFDLFNQRTVSEHSSGQALGVTVHIPAGTRWNIAVGYSQGRTVTLTENAFRDYARLDTQAHEWFYDSNYTFGGGFHSLDWLILSRHYREEASTVRFQSRVMSIGGEYLLYSRGRLDVTLGGGTDIQLNRVTGERTVQDFDYTRFVPELIWLDETYSGNLADYRRPIGAAVTTRSSAVDVQFLPYANVGIKVQAFGPLSVVSRVRWRPWEQSTVNSQESILDAYSTPTRSERFTFTAGATLAF